MTQDLSELNPVFPWKGSIQQEEGPFRRKLD
jgi:hypothetical protein